MSQEGAGWKTGEGGDINELEVSLVSIEGQLYEF